MSAAQVRHGLRRLLRVARRLDGDRIQLRSLLPVAGAHLPSSIDTAHDDAWDGKEEKTSVRSVVLGAVREASGDVSARPEGVRAMSRNAAALEAVIARADLATRAEAAFLASASDEPEAAGTSTSSDSSMSTSRAPSRETRLARLRGWRHLKDVLREHPEVAHRISKPRADMMRLVRAAIDSTLAQASTSRLMELGGASTSENEEDETGEWLRHASRTTLAARRDRAKRRAEARRIARQDPVTQWTTEAHLIDPDDQTIDDDDDDLAHPNRIFYEGRLDATLDSSASKKPDGTPDDILALFREMHAVGCPPNRRMYIRAMRGVARKDVNDPMKNSEPGSERALRLLWMLAHRSRESAEAGLRATPMGLGGVFSFQTAMSVGVRKAGSTGVVGLDGLCEGFGDAICEALLEAASNEGNEGSQTTRAHERALAAMGALTDLGAAPGTRTANDVLVAVCRAFAKNESQKRQNMNAKNIADVDDAQSIVITNQRRFRRVMDAALRAERHGSGLESSTWHALIECAERRGTLDDAFDCVLEFHAR